MKHLTILLSFLLYSASANAEEPKKDETETAVSEEIADKDDCFDPDGDGRNIGCGGLIMEGRGVVEGDASDGSADDGQTNVSDSERQQ